MSTPEHLDPESTAPDLPDGYDADGGWQRHEWLEIWDDVDPADFGLRRVADLRTAPGLLDELRPADFDDEERRP